MEKKKICFVVMGFGEKTDYRTSRVIDLDKTYKYIIKQAVTAAGLECIRADEIPHSGTIDVPMYEQLLAADLVIADLSTSNLNAAYELGVRHALKPRTTIVIAESQFVSPFDVNHIVIRKYQSDGKALDIEVAEKFRAELSKAIGDIMATDRTDSPVYTFLNPLQPPSRRAAAVAKAVADPPGAQNPALSVLMDQVQAKKSAAKTNEDWLGVKNLLQAILAIAPNDTYVVQQLALATYKSELPDKATALDDARKILDALDPLNSNNAETLGLLGAIHKRHYDLTNERDQLDTAIDAYEKGYRLCGDYYTGINFAFLLNQRAARPESTPADAITDYVLARRTRSDLLRRGAALLNDLKPDATGDLGALEDERYWLLATLAEAALGAGDDAGATAYLEQAKAVARQPWMVASTTEQLDKLRGLLAKSPLDLLPA